MTSIFFRIRMCRENRRLYWKLHNADLCNYSRVSTKSKFAVAFGDRIQSIKAIGIDSAIKTVYAAVRPRLREPVARLSMFSMLMAQPVGNNGPAVSVNRKLHLAAAMRNPSGENSTV